MAGPRYSIVPHDAVLDRRLSHLALHVLAVLGGHADNNGWCIVRLKTIAAAIGSSASKVSNAIAQLVDLGYLQKRERFGKNGAQLANLYQVSMDREPADIAEDDGVEVASEDAHPPLPSGQAPHVPEGKPPLSLRASHLPTEENDPSFERPFSPYGEARRGARPPDNRKSKIQKSKPPRPDPVRQALGLE